jgi:hypothetical protein
MLSLNYMSVITNKLIIIVRTSPVHSKFFTISLSVIFKLITQVYSMIRLQSYIIVQHIDVLKEH